MNKNTKYNNDKITSLKAFEHFIKQGLKTHEQEYNQYYKKTVNKFWKIKKIQEMKKTGAKFGNLYELYIAWMLYGQKNVGFECIVQDEKSGINPNDGVDIIVPFIDGGKKELWVVQVKTGKNRFKAISKDVEKLCSRSKEVIVGAQNHNISVEDYQKRWKISKKISKIIKDKNNSNEWKLKVFWATEIFEKQRLELIDKNVAILDIFKILKMRAVIKHPSLSNAILNKKFTIKSDHTNQLGQNAIFTGTQSDGEMLIVPLPIKQLIGFLEGVNAKDNNIDSVFQSNVRYSKGNNQISKRVVNSLINKPKDFLSLNNGVTMLAKKIKVNSNGANVEFEVKEMDIINGQQTVRTIWKNKDNTKIKLGEVFILLKVIKRRDDNLGREISSASNSQTAISASEIMSTFSFNYEMHKKLLDAGIFYKYKTGASDYDKQYSELPQITLKDILKYWIIQSTGNVWAKNELNSLMEVIAYGKVVKSPNTMEIAKKFNEKSDEELTKEFMGVATLMTKIGDFKNELQLTSSFDMFSYFAMKDIVKAEKFIKTFNAEINQFVESYPEIPGNNAANLFKSKIHTGNIFNKINSQFEELIK